MHRPVGVHQSVHAEAALQIRLIVLRPEVAAVQSTVPVRNGVIAPLPHEAAAQLLMRVDQLPVVAHVAAGISHGVRVFAQHKGLLHPFPEDPFDLRRGRIHAAAYVQAVLLYPAAQRGRIGALIVYGAAVRALEPARRRDEVPPPSGLVAQRPHDHALPVLVPLEHPPDPVHVHPLPFGIVGEQGKAVLRLRMDGGQPMRLQIGLLQHIDAVQVAQDGEKRMRRIVRRPHGVDMVALEHGQIALQILEALHVAVDSHRVTVDALEFDRSAVELKYAALCRDRSNPHELADQLATAVDDQRIDSGLLSIPKPCLCDAELDPFAGAPLKRFPLRRERQLTLPIGRKSDDSVPAAHVGLDPIVV